MIQDGEQRTLDWYRRRLGCFTGSKISDLMKTGRAKGATWSETAKAYMAQIAGERLFKPEFVADDIMMQCYVDQTSVTSKAMQWGAEMEAEAKSEYMQRTGAEVVEVEICTHDTIQNFAASPDGLIRNADGQGGMAVLEVKCPSLGVATTYMANVTDAATLKAVKPEYYWQMMAEMACTGTGRGVFLIYCPWMVTDLKAVDIVPDEADMALMLERVKAADAYADALAAKMRGD